MTRAGTVTPMTTALLIAIVVVAAPMPAQELPLGSRVRVRGACPAAPDCTAVTGSLQQRTGDSLVIRSGKGFEHRLHLGPAATLEVSRGHHGHTLQGLGIGALVGLGLGALDVKRCERAGELLCDLNYGFGTLAGAGLGMLIGYAIKTDEWEAVPRVSAVVAPSRSGYRLGLQLGF